MIFHFDDADFTIYEWHDQATHVHHKGQMKWWFVKRFLTPQMVQGYEFLFLWDDDLDVEDLQPLEYLRIARNHQLHLSSPSFSSQSFDSTYWPIMIVPSGAEKSGKPVRYTNFVECTAPVVSTRAWDCIWHYLQNDLSSGWGYDLGWYALCNEVLRHHTGLVDVTPITHKSARSAAGKTGFREKASKEQIALLRRFELDLHEPMVIVSAAANSHRTASKEKFFKNGVDEPVEVLGVRDEAFEGAKEMDEDGDERSQEDT